MSSLFRSTTTYDPIEELLNAETDDRRDELTQRWKDNKLQELNFIGIVVRDIAKIPPTVSDPTNAP